MDDDEPRLSVFVEFEGKRRAYSSDVVVLSILAHCKIAQGVLTSTDPTNKIKISNPESTVPDGHYKLDCTAKGDILPPLRPRTGSVTADPSYSEKHKDATIKRGTFKSLKEIDDKPSPILRHLWNSFTPPGLSWGSENDITFHVIQVFRQLFSALNLREQLDCFTELSVFQVRPDIWTVSTKFGIPIGVVKVKKPTDDLNEKKVGGQIFDYMMRLQTFHGIDNVFGIVTTYEKWWIVWFESANNAAQSTQVGEAPEPPSAELAEQVDVEVDEGETKVEILTDGIDRTLYFTEAMNYDNPILVRTLMSLIRKMYSSPISTVAEISLKRPYIVLDEESWEWCKVKWKTTVLNRHKLPTGRAERFILLRDLRGGADGRVWMACSTSGLVCVLKFAKFLLPYHRTKEELDSEIAASGTRLRHEQDMYKRLQQIETRLVRVGGRPALLLAHYSDCDLSNMEVHAKVEKLICQIGAQGYFIADIKKEHIFIESPHKPGEEAKARIIDLASARPINKDETVDGVIEVMKRLVFVDDPPS